VPVREVRAQLSLLQTKLTQAFQKPGKGRTGNIKVPRAREKKGGTLRVGVTKPLAKPKSQRQGGS